MFGENLKILTQLHRPTTGHRGRKPDTVKDVNFHTQAKLPRSKEELENFLALEIAAAEFQIQQSQATAIQKAIATPSIVDFIETKCIDPTTVNAVTNDYSNAKLIQLASHQKRILNHVLTIDPQTGLFPYRTVVYSAPKKSGKTAVSACVGAYFARHIEAPNAVMVLGNKLDQATDRAFLAMLPTLEMLGGIRTGSTIKLPANGSIVRALPNEPTGEAGGTYGLTIWTELWGFFTERHKQFWAELMPVNTRNNSMRWVDSYAGYEDKSDLLLSLFLEVFTDVTETKLQKGAIAVPELSDIVTTDKEGNTIPCCYAVPSKGLFYYNDHEHRMPWQIGKNAAKFYAESTIGLTETDITRLIHNRWQATENSFATDEEQTASFERGIGLPCRIKSVYAIDASKTTAGTALVGVYEDAQTRHARTSLAQVWYPQQQKIKGEIDLEQTVIAEVIKLYQAGLIEKSDYKDLSAKEKKLVDTEGCTAVEVWYDPFQMAQVAINLRKNHKILMREFSQQTLRERADTALQLRYQNGTIDNPALFDLKEHLTSAKSQTVIQKSGDTTRIRIVKGEGSHAKPNDLIVAQSMACFALSLLPVKMKFLALGQSSAKTPNT